MNGKHIDMRWARWFIPILGDDEDYLMFVELLKKRIQNFAEGKYIRNLHEDTYFLKDDLRKVVVDMMKTGMKKYQIAKEIHCGKKMLDALLTDDDLAEIEKNVKIKEKKINKKKDF